MHFTSFVSLNLLNTCFEVSATSFSVLQARNLSHPDRKQAQRGGKMQCVYVHTCSRGAARIGTSAVKLQSSCLNMDAAGQWFSKGDL